MKEEIYNEQELKRLEEEIRSLGIPYSQNEPDERYFTNFRVHLMDRIEEKEKKQSIFGAVLEWLTSSPLRYISLGATLAGIVVAVFVMHPAPEAPVAAIEQPSQQSVQIPSVMPPTEMKQEIKQQIAAVAKPQKAEPVSIKNTNIASNEHRRIVLKEADKAADFASIDETLSGSGADSDDPINLENLSESELESVITVAQDMK